MAQKWSNANSFFNGMQNGIRFVGDLYALRDSREDRERAIKRQAAQDRREEDRFNLFSRQSDDSHERSVREQEEYDANAGLRDIGRKNKILKAQRIAEDLKDEELHGLTKKATRAKLKNAINTQKKNEIELAILEKTKNAKIDKINDWKNSGDGKNNAPRYKAANGMYYTVKDVTNAYDKYLKYATQKNLEGDKVLSQKEFVDKLFDKKSDGKGNPDPGSKPDLENLSQFDADGSKKGWWSEFLGSF